MLLAARQDGHDVALGLLNRTPSRLAPDTLWLGESGVAERDSIFIEHNGLLVARGAEAALQPSMNLLLGGSWRRRLVLSGVSDAHLAAACATSGAVRIHASRPAPFVALQALPAGGFLAALSASTRYQLRRSARRYASHGPPAIRRAETLAEALDTLDELAVLHQATWTARGKPGAFANTAFRRFHAALIERALPRGEVDLLRIAAGEKTIGCLYNFRFASDVLAYQSGFDYAVSDPHEKPGLTCHHLAIEAAQAEGARRYDFLAGEDRYKASLAGASETLHWLDIVPRWSPRGVIQRLRPARSGIAG